MGKTIDLSDLVHIKIAESISSHLEHFLDLGIKLGVRGGLTFVTIKCFFLLKTSLYRSRFINAVTHHQFWKIWTKTMRYYFGLNIK